MMKQSLALVLVATSIWTYGCSEPSQSAEKAPARRTSQGLEVLASQEIRSLDLCEYREFGMALALDGPHLAVLAPQTFDRVCAQPRGVIVYEHNGESFQFLARVQPSGSPSPLMSLDMDDGVLALAAAEGSEHVVYLYERELGQMLLVQRLVVGAYRNNLLPVAIDGDTLVAAVGTDDGIIANVYTRGPEGFAYLQTLAPPTNAAGIYLDGDSLVLALSGDAGPEAVLYARVNDTFAPVGEVDTGSSAWVLGYHSDTAVIKVGGSVGIYRSGPSGFTREQTIDARFAAVSEHAMITVVDGKSIEIFGRAASGPWQSTGVRTVGPQDARWLDDWSRDYYYEGAVAASDAFVAVSSPESGPENGYFYGSVDVFEIDGARKAPGRACFYDLECDGYCVDGVCCASHCGGGFTDDCVACSVSAGGSADGTCTSVADGQMCAAGVCAQGVCGPEVTEGSDAGMGVDGGVPDETADAGAAEPADAGSVTGGDAGAMVMCDELPAPSLLSSHKLGVEQSWTLPPLEEDDFPFSLNLGLAVRELTDVDAMARTCMDGFESEASAELCVRIGSGVLQRKRCAGLSSTSQSMCVAPVVCEGDPLTAACDATKECCTTTMALGVAYGESVSVGVPDWVPLVTGELAVRFSLEGQLQVGSASGPGCVCDPDDPSCTCQPGASRYWLQGSAGGAVTGSGSVRATLFGYEVGTGAQLKGCADLNIRGTTCGRAAPAAAMGAGLKVSARFDGFKVGWFTVDPWEPKNPLWSYAATPSACAGL